MVQGGLSSVEHWSWSYWSLSEKQKSLKTGTAKIPPISGSQKFASSFKTTTADKELARRRKETGINFPSAPIAKKKPWTEV